MNGRLTTRSMRRLYALRRNRRETMMLAKLVMVGILALLCLTALVVTRASYAGHSVPAHPSTSLQQH